MSIAIIMTFDTVSDARVRRFWNALEGPGLVAPNLGRPHLTFAAILPDDLEPAAEALEDVAAGLHGTTVTFDSIGVFVGEAPILFLNPTPSATLLALHRRVHEALRKAGVRPDGPSDLYAPGSWVPHVTLGVVTGADRLGAAMGVANGFRLRFEVTGVALSAMRSDAFCPS